MKRRILSMLLVFALALSLAPTAGAADDGVTYRSSGLASVEKLTLAEALAVPEYEQVPSSVAYTIKPSVSAPYAVGKLSPTSVESGINYLNKVRRLAGLGPVSNDTSFEELAQSAALVNAANSRLSHYPEQPAGMSEEMYQQGRKGASSSNIAYTSMRSVSLPYFVDMWMEDSDASNIDRLGHRRWLINPSMGRTGFGMANSEGGASFSAIYAFDTGNSSATDYDFISWPASGYFPKAMFGKNYAWSVTLNPSRFSTPSYSDVEVTITDPQGTEHVMSADNAQSASGLFFNVETSGYGVSNCIIFRPDIESGYTNGVYTVRIDGLKTRSGEAVTDFAYQVEFVDESSIKPTFDDVSAGSYYFSAVEWAFANGVTTGTSTTTFSPGDICTRGQVLTFLWRAMNEPEPTTTVNPFVDVKPSDYFYKAVLWGVEQGITTGTSTTTFSPDETCSFAHILTFIWRSLDRPSYTGVGEWYDDAFAWAQSGGLLANTNAASGIEASCPRSDVVTYLYRVLGK